MCIEEVNGKENILNPIWSSWIRPRETIKYVISNNRRQYYPLLICLYGLIRSMDYYVRSDYTINLMIVLILMVVSPVSGYIGCYLFAWIISIFGRVLEGHADNEELRLSILWSTVPMMMILPISFSIFILGADNVYINVINNIVLLVVYWLLSVIEVVIALWVFINLVRMVSEVQGFSNGKAFLSIILPSIILVGLLIGSMIFINFAA
jgi:hypothetical protein